MAHRIICIFLFGISFSSQCQSFQIDSTFSPFFDIRDQSGAQINDIYESKTKKIYFTGAFRINLSSGLLYNGLASINMNGERNLNFTGTDGGGGIIQPISDSVFVNGSNQYGLLDTNGNRYNYAWLLNYTKSVRCRTGFPYFFPDGSSLFGNYADNTGKPCEIINPPDTFKGRHIIKLTPEGLWDSSFVGDANYQPQGFFQYDSARLIVYGNPRNFKTYNGVKIEGMCRIFLDGSLDTSFTSPLIDTNFSSFAKPALIQKNGSFYIHGKFLLKANNSYSTLAKLNSDGSLDSSFMNFSGATDTVYLNGGINTIAPTDDGGFLVGGRFSHYQGVIKNAIAKIDSNGRLQPQFFTSVGPDSAKFITGDYTVPTINIISKSKFGGYYVGGNFLTWDGQPSQPIIRLTGLDSADWVDTSTSVIEITQAYSQVKLYPNPTNGKVYLISNEIISEISVLNAVGQLVQSFQPHNNRFDWVLPEPKGIYFIKLLDKSGYLKSKIIINQ